ncbi:MAG TPA: 30S ribosomal protein S17 [Candidatus Nanoarchaeia archaeon]|nr:30S ribosomal protein S17P [uncultured archaeon]HLC63470.1 30S ribosomal protein S17 [Candidatus Nanoarchaeia archaeon]
MEKTKAKNIGLKVEAPKKECSDKNCPFHSSQKVRGRIIECKVVKTDPFKSATVTFERIHQLPKYERFEKRTSKIHVHNPPCINAQSGDKVTIAETRPISKTKNFVIVQIHKNDRLAGINKDSQRGLQ